MCFPPPLSQRKRLGGSNILSVEDSEPSYLLKNNDRSRLKVLGLVFEKPADPMTSLPLIQQASLVKGFFESKQPLFVLQLQILEP